MQNLYRTIDSIARSEYPNCTCYYDDGCGYVGFRCGGVICWWRWDVLRGRYVRSGSTCTAEGAQRRRLDE